MVVPNLSSDAQRSRVSVEATVQIFYSMKSMSMSEAFRCDRDDACFSGVWLRGVTRYMVEVDANSIHDAGFGAVAIHSFLSPHKIR